MSADTRAPGEIPGPDPLETVLQIEEEVVRCERCPRLVAWREEAALHPPRRFQGETYWARPLPAFGDPAARILLVGLAPAANGGNRTGRMFTGDASGDFLFRALHAVGLANQAESRHAGDGLVLRGALVTAAVRCAPPDNRPLPSEFAACRGYLERELAALPDARVLVALGGLAFDTCLAALARAGEPVLRPRPKFGHGASFEIGSYRLLATYHPSQQNTFTGRLTSPMLEAVFRKARELAGAAPDGSAREVSSPTATRKSSRSPAPPLPRRPTARDPTSR